MRFTSRLIIAVLVFSLVSQVAMAEQYRPGAIIVKFRPASSLAESYVASGMSGEERPIRVDVDDVKKALVDLNSKEDVEYAEPDYLIKAEQIPNDWPYNESEWADVDLEQAWDLIESKPPGSRVVIAVVDSGVDSGHPDLQGILVGGYDFANNDSDPEDNAGHGTEVCGIIGAIGNNNEGIAGVDWDVPVEIMPLKFMEADDNDCSGYISDAVDAIYYAVDHGADIINASWGFDSFSNALQDAIKYARDHGVLFVTSAGNSSKDNDTNDHYPSNYDLDNIIAVAAMDRYGELASFSNYGLNTVDIAAPGVGIVTTTINGAYVNWASGTSFATPFVTAIAAMVESEHPGLPYNDVRERILRTSVMADDYSEKLLDSGGCINAYNALLGVPEHALPSDQVSEQPSTANTVGNSPVLVAGEGGGGGGGMCIIEVSEKAPASPFLLLVLILIMLLIPSIGLKANT